MKEIYRILDANFNRAREALRVAEDCGRFVLNDPAVTAMAKNSRSDLREIFDTMPIKEMVVSRDAPGDVGTELSSPSELARDDITDVVTAACKRLTEALRTLEEYSKFVSPEHTQRFERIRYDSYTLEQRLLGRLWGGRAMADVGLYLLVSSKIVASQHASVLQTVRAAIAGGVEVVQLREKPSDTCDAVTLALAAELRELTDEMGKRLIINDRPDIAAIVGADGVHLGQHDLPIAEARRLLRPGAIVGRSTHNIAQAQTAVQEGADYIALGPVFETDTKDAGPIAGLELLKQASADPIVNTLPLVAIGGINASNAAQVVDAGVSCLAICGAICNAPDPKTAAREIREQIK
ncbi:MAG: thiamine phosphate synthase [Phycisphaerales bacterium]|jgi:thiamine-phosphate pyrophosphorylase|nr:thiamine phosphate synthase [Phycisphaerales bacterium]